MENDRIDQEIDEAEAVRALQALQATRRQLERQARWSLGRHASVGLAAGGMIAGFALPSPWPLIVVAAGLIATAMIVARDRRRDGFFVSGYREGKTRRLTFAIVLFMWAALLAAMELKIEFTLAWAPVVVGVVVALVVTVSSILWERVYRQELSEALIGR